MMAQNGCPIFSDGPPFPDTAVELHQQTRQRLPLAINIGHCGGAAYRQAASFARLTAH